MVLPDRLSRQLSVQGIVDGVGKAIIGLGKIVARLHTGMIQYRLMVMFAAVILLIHYIGWGF